MGRRQPMAATAPPSTRTSVPVMKLAPSEQRKEITAATSSGLPIRRSELPSAMAEVPAVSAISNLPIGVLITPGDTERILAPRRPHEGATRRMSRMTPSLAMR
jgi:hypothetical protein